jgi:phage shock protein E
MLKEQIENEQGLLVDVREEAEWKDGYISDAIHLPLSKILEGSLQETSIPFTQVLYLYCNSGQRTLRAAPLLKNFHPQIVPLKWGFKDLASNGFPVSKP